MEHITLTATNTIDGYDIVCSQENVDDIKKIVLDILNSNYIMHQFITTYKSLHIVDYDNQKLLISILDDVPFIIDVYYLGNKNPYLINSSFTITKLVQSQINDFITEDNILFIKSLIESIIVCDKTYIENNNDLFDILNIIGTLLPKNIINKSNYSFGYNSKVMFINTYIEDPNANFFDSLTLDYPFIEINEYSNQAVELLCESLDSCNLFVKEIDKLMTKYSFDINLATDIYNLTKGKIEHITDLNRLLNIIRNIKDKKFDFEFICSIIYSNIFKFEITKDILELYSFIYKYYDKSRDYIISTFFDNINVFSDDLIYENIINIAPFNLVDYVDYLKRYNLYYDFRNDEAQNNKFLLFNLILDDIKLNNLCLVPNEDLLYYLKNIIENENKEALYYSINQINKLNKKAGSRLLDVYLNRMEKSVRNSIFTDISFEYFIYILENMQIEDSYQYYIKEFNFVRDRNKYIKYLKEREKDNNQYYSKLLSKLVSTSSATELMKSYKMTNIYIEDNIDINYLTQVYEEIYLDKYERGYLLFTDKIMIYLESCNNKIDSTIDVYNRFFKNLDIHYKNVLDSIRKLNDFMYNYPDEILDNLDKYYPILKEFDDILVKYKTQTNKLFIFINDVLIYLYHYKNKEYELAYDDLSKILKNEEYRMYMYNHYFLNMIDTYFKNMSILLNNNKNILDEYFDLFDCYLQQEMFFSKLVYYLDNNSSLEYIGILLSLYSNSDNKLYLNMLTKLLNLKSKADIKLLFDRFNNSYIYLSCKNKMRLNSYIINYSSNRFNRLYTFKIKNKYK